MALIAVGASFRTAPVEVREKFAYTDAEVAGVLSRIRAAGAREAALLSTCNRTEFYLVDSESDPIPAVWNELSTRLGDDAQPFGYVRRDREAAAHLFRVASGLDSMILGEAQIQGQVRDAWEASRSQSGAALNRLFQSALSVASRVRTETAVGRGAASVSSAAVQLAKQIFGSLRGRRVMVLGAGEMAELALQCLMAEGVRAAIVANRTYERAAELARLHGATALHYDACWAQLADVDVVITSTSAPHPVVRPEHITPTLAARGDRPLCILDIALPRDVDPAVRDLANVYLYDLDDLRSVVAATIGRRHDELPTAEALLGDEVERYWNWLAGLASVPVLTTLRSEMDRVREQELAGALRRLGHLAPADREAVEHLSRALMNKFLHAPSVRLRAAAANGRGLGVVDAAKYLFALDTTGADAPSDDPTPRQTPVEDGPA
jgi:glutamyl-tRNA reductase